MKNIMFYLFTFLFILGLVIANDCFLDDVFFTCDSYSSCTFKVKASNLTNYNINYQLMQNGSRYSIDLTNLPDEFIFLKSSGKCEISEITPIITFVEDIPVNGGSITIKGVLIFDEFEEKVLTFNSKTKTSPIYPKLASSKSFLINVPDDCGNYTLTYNSNLINAVIYNGSYIPSKVNPRKIENGVNVSYSGSNIYNPQLTIYGTNFQKPTIIKEEYFSTNKDFVNYIIPEIRYCGEWTIKFYSCGNEFIENNNKIINYPSIEGLTSVPAQEGGIVTIYGSNLYSRSLDAVNPNTSGYKIIVKAKYSNDQMECSNIKYENNLLTCQMPPKTTGAKSNLNFTLTIDNNFSNSANFSYDKPSISSVVQISEPSEGNAQFNISGRYLNDGSITKVIVKLPNISNNPSFNDHSCTIVNRNADFMIVEVPLNAYPAYIVIVSIDGDDQINSNIGNLKFKPIIYNATKPNTNGGSITITGVSIHTQRIKEGNKLENIPDVVISINEIVASCSSPFSIDGTHIVCLMGEGSGNNLTLTVKLGEFKNEIPFSYNGPEVADIKYIYTNITSNTSDLPGINYGNDINQVSISTKDMNLKVLYVNHTFLQFYIPEELNDINNLTIKVGPENHQNELVYEFVVKNIIESVNSIPVSGGIVTFKGRHFSNQTNVSIREPRNKPASIKCLNVKVNQDRTELYCNIEGVSPKDNTGAGERKLTSGKNLNIFMTTKGREAKNEKGITFSFFGPTINGTLGKIGLSGGLVTIAGDNFNRKGLYINIGDRTCKNPDIINFKTVTCSLSSITVNQALQYQNKTFSVYVEVDGQSTILENSFSYSFDNSISQKKEERSPILIPGVVIIGAIAILTGSILLYNRIDRYLRMKKIQRIMNKKHDELNG